MFPVVLYADANYGGATATVPYMIPTSGINTPPSISNFGFASGTLSSIKVAAHTRVALVDSSGSSIRIFGPKNIPDLKTFTVPFDNKTTKIAVLYNHNIPLDNTLGPTSTFGSISGTMYPVLLYPAINYGQSSSSVGLLYNNDSYKTTPIAQSLSTVFPSGILYSIKVKAYTRVRLSDGLNVVTVNGPLDIPDLSALIPTWFNKIQTISIQYDNGLPPATTPGTVIITPPIGTSPTPTSPTSPTPTSPTPTSPTPTSPTPTSPTPTPTPTPTSPTNALPPPNNNPPPVKPNYNIQIILVVFMLSIIFIYIQYRKGYSNQNRTSF